MVLPGPPVHQQLLHQERRGDHADAVVHPAGLPQLPHPRVHDRDAGAPAPPGPQLRRGIAERQGGEGRAHRLLRHVGPVEQQVGRELPPQDLAQEGFEALAGALRRLLGHVPNLAGADLAPVQVGGQAAGAFLSRQVAAGVVAVHGAVQECIQARVGRGLAGLPHVEPGGPVRLMRQQVPAFQRVGRDSWAGRNVPGRGQRFAGAAAGTELLGEGRVNAVDTASLRAYAVEVEQGLRAMQVQRDARCRQRGLDPLGRPACPGFMLMAGVDRHCASLPRQIRQHRRCPATSQHERRSQTRQFRAERREAMMQPPARGTAEAPAARRFVVEHINWQDRMAASDGRVQRRMVPHP